MSWYLDLTVDPPVTTEDAAAIVARLPPDLHSPFAPLTDAMQAWGWSRVTDICVPQGALWRISGAGYSRQHASPMALTLATQLRERGYQVVVGERVD